MKKPTPPEIILFDWHATLVATPEALYHAVEGLADPGGDCHE